MFQIKKYLHYKNTPDGKPEVLEEARDFSHKSYNKLWLMIGNQKTVIANLKDCRPLLTVEIDGEEWTEGDIALKDDQYGILYYNNEGANFMFNFKSYALCIFYLHPRYFDDFQQFNFFDDPAKYSKLLWNCTEEEGWEKVLELLNI